MKKIIALLLAVIMIVSLCSCFDFGNGGGNNGGNNNGSGNNVDPDANLPGIGEGEGVEGPRVPWN